MQSAAQSASATPSARPAEVEIERWYSTQQVERGGVLFSEHCAGCHGAHAEGTPAWRERDANGKLPPPPLDGTAHAWHHPFAVLHRQIKFGTPASIGSMPGFGEKLTDQDIVDVIAWVQARWPTPIYAAWADISRRAAKP